MFPLLIPGKRSSGLGGGGGSASHDWLSIISKLDLDWKTIYIYTYIFSWCDHFCEATLNWTFDTMMTVVFGSWTPLLFLPDAALPECRCPGSWLPAEPQSAEDEGKEAAHTHSGHPSFCPGTCTEYTRVLNKNWPNHDEFSKLLMFQILKSIYIFVISWWL